MTPGSPRGLAPDLFGQLAATDPIQRRRRRLFGRGRVEAVSGNQADLLVGYDAQGNALLLREVPIISGYVPRAGDWVVIQYEGNHAGAPWVAGPSMSQEATQDSAGIGVFPISRGAPESPQASMVYFDDDLAAWRGYNGSEWVDFSASDHGGLGGLQGGAPGEYYHLTAAEYAGTWRHQLIAITGEQCPLEGVRTSDEVGIGQTGVLAKAISSGDMLDGFGSGYLFAIQDDAAVENIIAAIYGIRDGADNTGALLWKTATAGTLEERMRLTATGALAISAGFTGTSATLTGLTAGQVVYPGAGGVLSGSANLFWDNGNNQLLLGVGSAAHPSYSFVGRATDGMFSAGAGELGWVIAGVEQMRLSAVDLLLAGDLRVDGGDIGNTTYPDFIQFSYDDIILNATNLKLLSQSGAVVDILVNTADGADNKNLRVFAGGAASPARGSGINFYGNESVSTNYHGVLGFMAGVSGEGGTYSDSYLWYVAGAIHSMLHRDGYWKMGGDVWPWTDNSYTLGSAALGWQALYLADAAHSPAANGEVRASTTRNSLTGRMGDTNVYYAGTVKNVDSALAEFESHTNLVQTMWSDTVDKDLWVTGKPINVFAAMRLRLPAAQAGANYSCTVEILLGTEVICGDTMQHSYAVGESSSYYYVELHSRVTKYAGTSLRNAASLKQSGAVAIASWSEGAHLELTEYAEGRADPVTEEVTSANVTLQVRVTFSHSVAGLKCKLMDAGWGPETPVV